MEDHIKRIESMVENDVYYLHIICQNHAVPPELVQESRIVLEDNSHSRKLIG